MKTAPLANKISLKKRTLLLLTLFTFFFGFSQKDDFLLKYPGKQKAFIAGVGIGLLPMEDDNNVLVSIGLGLTTSLIQAGKEGNKFDPGIMGATALGTLTTIFLKKQIKAFRKRKAYKRKLQKNHST